MSYLLLKSLHILGIVLFLGNIIITGVWKVWADTSRDWRVILFAQRLVTYTDILFTLPGVLLIAITGTMMASTYGHWWEITWLRWGLSLFIISGIIWLIVLIPVQIVLHRLAIQFQQTEQISQQYWTYEIIWGIFGTIATLLPLMNLYWMVFKPV